MTPMVVYDCQVCGSHSARRLNQMPWQCDVCQSEIAVGGERDIAIVFVPDDTKQNANSNYSSKQSYSYSKEIFTERGVEAYEAVNA